MLLWWLPLGYGTDGVVGYATQDACNCVKDEFLAIEDNVVDLWKAPHCRKKWCVPFPFTVQQVHQSLKAFLAAGTHQTKNTAVPKGRGGTHTCTHTYTHKRLLATFLGIPCCSQIALLISIERSVCIAHLNFAHLNSSFQLCSSQLIISTLLISTLLISNWTLFVHCKT